jgi:hypothetical protein
MHGVTQGEVGMGGISVVTDLQKSETESEEMAGLCFRNMMCL